MTDPQRPVSAHARSAIRDLRTLSGKALVPDGVGLNVGGGDNLVLIGNSGSGKTVLLHNRRTRRPAGSSQGRPTRHTQSPAAHDDVPNGLRVSQFVSLRLNELNLHPSTLPAHRLMGGISVRHLIESDVLHAIRRYLGVRQGDQPRAFPSEWGQPPTRRAVSYFVGLAAQRAGLPGFHPHTRTAERRFEGP